MTAAPLKRRGFAGGENEIPFSPRSHDRGPLKLRFTQGSFTHRENALRGHMTAAPLKRTDGDGRWRWCREALRGHMTAAPLKRWEREKE